MSELIVFLTGVAVGAGGLLVILSIIRINFSVRDPHKFIREMLNYIDIMSLPVWSNGSTRNRLENKLRLRVNNNEDPHYASDAVFIVQLFLELGREIEEAGE